MYTLGSSKKYLPCEGLFWKEIPHQKWNTFSACSGLIKVEPDGIPNNLKENQQSNYVVSKKKLGIKSYTGLLKQYP